MRISFVFKKLFLLIFIFFCFFLLKAQSPANCYRIYISDKNNTPYSTNDPSAYLSQRAIDKRQRFQIEITEEDLPLNPSYIEAILAQSEQIRLLTHSKWHNTVTVYCPETDKLQQIENLPFVLRTEPVAFYTGSEGRKVSDPFTKESFRESPLTEKNVSGADYGFALTQMQMHRGQLLHEEGFRGEGMLIAVFDAGWNGFDTISHFRSLYERGQIAGIKNLVPGEANIYTGHSHGTSVTSLMAISLNGTMVGTAPKSYYYFIRSEDPRSEQPIEEDYWSRAAEIADSIGADLINSSLGYTDFPDFPSSYWTYAQSDGRSGLSSLSASIAVRKGIIVCTAAGNEGLNNWRYIGRPADARDILTVGGVKSDSVHAGFSSVGPSYDGRVKPDVASLGHMVICAMENGRFMVSNGTSLATPIITGLTACLWQALPEKSASDIIQIIRENSNRYDSPDTLTGYGIPDFYKAYQKTTHIDSYNRVPEITVYPNPCITQFSIPDVYTESMDIYLYDINGRMVHHQKLSPGNTAIVKIAHLPSGIYIGRAVSSKGEKRFKIVKS